MSDISALTKFLENPYAPTPQYVKPRFTALIAKRSRLHPEWFIYRLGYRKDNPLSRLFTYSLPDARAAAESFGLPVKECGPPEAFGRKSKPIHRVSESTIAAFWHVCNQGDEERLVEWLRRHRDDAPILLALAELCYFWHDREARL